MTNTGKPKATAELPEYEAAGRKEGAYRPTP
jgi:hypothetical protein